MADRLRSLAFATIFYGLSVPIVLCAPIAGLFGTRALRAYANGWAGFAMWSARHIAGIGQRIEGQHAAGPALYAAKHQSMYETLALARMLDAPAIVMKRELARIPVWGWAARRYGVIVVDRTASATALRQMMREATAARGEGRSVLIFPEGTRVAPGEAPPLRSGFAGLYRALGLPVVPVALDSGKVWPREGHKRAGTVTFRFGAPIAPGLDRRAAEAAVHAGINALEQGAPG
ncbi:lysophospholipid acyltransferase family protein [Sphingomonas sp.]|uniref:lysophospholipid acyltransferase family protein n=1 Tax=Sphingomonas sp. TaxID=28214 RepID=UPI001EBAB99D|nr:lysophospholipid acyltransferase family protein [Sphingomonas sp.]MBX3595369.1 1-acyl-sn-glycerol-3-phosphate acyltransferase [Sphingomonas sp.]